MQFFQTLLVGAAALASVVSAQNRLYFTKWDSAVKAGQPTTFTWVASSDAPVTIKLREGPSGNLRDVLTVTSDATGGSYTWTPPADDLFNSGNYAFEISQEGAEPNYTGQFAIGDANGASPAPETSTPSATPAPSSTAEESSAESTAESTTAESSAESTAAPTTMATETTAATSTHASTHASSSGAPTQSAPAPGNSAPAPGNSAASFKSSAALVLAAVGAFALFQ